MEYPPKYHKHVRLRANDYTRGAYFVTLCTDPRRELFGPIVGHGVNARIDLNDLGRIVDECWRAIPDHFPHVRLDQTQIMPDHLHSILVLNGVGSTQWVDATGATRTVGTRPRGPVPGSLGAIIGAFKSVTTKRINVALDAPVDPSGRTDITNGPSAVRVANTGALPNTLQKIRRNGGNPSADMQRRLMYIEKGTGYNHDGPAWIGYVDFSRTGRKAYFNGQAFSSSKRYGRCLETGELYWISGVKKRGNNRHVFGHGKILVASDALPEFLALKGWNRLDETHYGVFDAKPTDIAKFNALENLGRGQ